MSPALRRVPWECKVPGCNVGGDGGDVAEAAALFDRHYRREHTTAGEEK